MISKESVLITPNSAIMASMYATMATTKHTSLNPKKQADFAPEYLMEMLRHILIVDVEEKIKEYAEQKKQRKAVAIFKNYSDENKKGEHLENIESMFALKNKRIAELAILQQKFYTTLTNFTQMLDDNGEVDILLDTDSYYNALKFDFEKALVGDYVIYDEQFLRKLEEVKSELRAAIEEQNYTDHN